MYSRLEVGKSYPINEDIRGFIDIKENKRDFEIIPAGTLVKLVKIDGDIIIIEYKGVKVVTESHKI